jgi:hypothetical protein
MIRLLARFSTDARIRALRQANERMASALGEAYAINYQRQAMGEALNQLLATAVRERDEAERARLAAESERDIAKAALAEVIRQYERRGVERVH